VEWLVAFGALSWVGAVFAPFLGIAGDRLGLRTLLCMTRGVYAVAAATLTVLTLLGALTPVQVFVLYGITGLMRPSDQATRNVLIAHTATPATLMGALGVSRTTADMAKVLGSLAGAGGVAMIGMAPAYVIVTLLYVSAFLLTLGVAQPPLHAARASAHDVLTGLKDVMRYVWRKPDLFGAFAIVFLTNLLAFPFVLGLLPYAAKEIYQVGQAGLGYLAAAFALGALIGSIMVGTNSVRLRAGRAMLWSCGVWFVTLVLFGQTQSFALGVALLLFSGFMQSLCLTPLAAVMLRGSSVEMRGRVMGMRVLAIWGLPLGLLAL
jgi:predicted MFS family arabinose efflux permease